MDLREVPFTMDLDATHAAVEALLMVNGFDIQYSLRDSAEDWGDDGGFVITLSKKDSKFYVHILEVNYNFTLDSVSLEDTSEVFKSEDSALLWLNTIGFLINAYEQELASVYSDDTAEKMVKKCPEIEPLIDTIGIKFVRLMASIDRAFNEHYVFHLNAINNFTNYKYVEDMVMYNTETEEDFIICKTQ